jgi:hypothetical protein
MQIHTPKGINYASVILINMLELRTGQRKSKDLEVLKASSEHYEPNLFS